MLFAFLFMNYLSFNFFIFLCNKYFPSIFKAVCLLNTPSKSGSSRLDFYGRNWLPEAIFLHRLEWWRPESSSSKSSPSAKNRSSGTAPFRLTPLRRDRGCVYLLFYKIFTSWLSCQMKATGVPARRRRQERKPKINPTRRRRRGRGLFGFNHLRPSIHLDFDKWQAFVKVQPDENQPHIHLVTHAFQDSSLKTDTSLKGSPMVCTPWRYVNRGNGKRSLSLLDFHLLQNELTSKGKPIFLERSSSKLVSKKNCWLLNPSHI